MGNPLTILDIQATTDAKLKQVGQMKNILPNDGTTNSNIVYPIKIAEKCQYFLSILKISAAATHTVMHISEAIQRYHYIEMLATGFDQAPHFFDLLNHLQILVSIGNERHLFKIRQLIEHHLNQLNQIITQGGFTTVKTNPFNTAEQLTVQPFAQIINRNIMAFFVLPDTAHLATRIANINDRKLNN
ncbi:hypothetical protein D3C79_603250 [compost metagenome]